MRPATGHTAHIPCLLNPGLPEDRPGSHPPKGLPQPKPLVATQEIILTGSLLQMSHETGRNGGGPVSGEQRQDSAGGQRQGRKGETLSEQWGGGSGERG